jgi:hypothetical protein
MANAMNVYVKPNEEQCFMEEAKRGEKLITSFNVAAGGMDIIHHSPMNDRFSYLCYVSHISIGFLDIDVRVYGPDMKVIFEAEREKDGSFSFVAQQTGSHRFCFGNTMSTGMYVYVYFV